MAERIKNLGFRDDIIGGSRSSGFQPQAARGNPLQGVFAFVENIKRSEQQEKLRAEREKEKALKTYLDTVSVDYKTNIDVFEQESPRNAQMIVNKSTAYRDGIVTTAPPSLQPLIGARIDNYINLKRAKANTAATAEIQADNQANEDRLGARNFAILNESAEGLYSSDTDLRNASENEVESLERELSVRLFSQGVDAFGAPFDLHKRDDITARLQNFQDTKQSSAIKGWFRDQPSQERAFLQLKRGGFKTEVISFKRNRKDGSVEETFKQVDVMDVLSEPARTKLFEDLGSEMRASNALEDKEDKEETEDNVKAQRLNGFDNWRKINEPEPNEAPLTVDTIRQQLEAGLITKDDAVAQQKTITEPETVVDDPDYYNTVDQQIDLGVDFLSEINEGFSAGLLTKSSAASLRAENRRALNAERTSIEKAIDDAASDTLKDLNTGLKVNTLFTILDRDQGPRQVRARQEARRRINELKNESEINTIEDVELFREKLNRLNAELIRTHRFKERRGPTPLPPVVPVLTREQVTQEKLKQGYERLNKMRADGDISNEEFNRQAREIMIEVQREKNKNPESGAQ